MLPRALRLARAKPWRSLAARSSGMKVSVRRCRPVLSVHRCVPRAGQEQLRGRDKTPHTRVQVPSWGVIGVVRCSHTAEEPTLGFAQGWSKVRHGVPVSISKGVTFAGIVHE
jgi:hypothetical protein